MTELVFRVRGIPVPQGSKNVFTNKKTGKPILVESQGTKLEVWRTQVVLAARKAAQNQSHNGTMWEQPAGPVQANIVFYLPRPKAHFGTGRNAMKLKPSAPIWCDVKPDKDKLVRAVFDGLTMSGVISDDARIVTGYYEKVYADTDDDLGATILIKALE